MKKNQPKLQVQVNKQGQGRLFTDFPPQTFKSGPKRQPKRPKTRDLLDGGDDQ